MAKILLIDADSDYAEAIAFGLRRDGINISVTPDGLQGLRRWEAEPFDLVIVDADAPCIDGYDLCRQIRERSDTPVIITSSLYRDDVIVRGYQAGADDFVGKPFSLRQLALRIKAVLRRVRASEDEHPSSVVKVGALVLDGQSHEVVMQGVPVRLTPLEFRIAYMLALNAGRVVPTERLVQYAWGYDGGDAGMLKTHICHIRQKLGLRPGSPYQIKAVPGVGYTLPRPAPAAAAS